MSARRPFFFIAGLLLAIAGCGSRNPETQAPADAAVSVDAPVGSDTALSLDVGPTSGVLDGGVTPVSDTAVGLDAAAADRTPADGQAFGPGIYYRQPRLTDPAATLARVSPPLDVTIMMSPVGFDVAPDKVVFPYPGGLVVANVRGERRLLPVPGLLMIARPSLSPDGKRVAVQATTSPVLPPTDLDIFVVSLEDAKFQRVGNLTWNEESPRWFPRSNRIAYSSFSPTDGVNLHVYDLDAGKETVVVKDGGALQIAVSPDERRIAEFWRLRLFDADTGAVVGDLRAPLEAALAATGFTADKDNPGMGGRMTFALDGAFSPDGTSLVLDGAVSKGGKTGSVLFTTPVAAPALTAVTPLVEIEYDFSNQNNFSQLNPLWR